MKTARPSSTAQHVALGRAHLTWLGVVDDPQAEGMLRPGWAGTSRALRHRPLTGLGRNRSWAYLGARTLFYDGAVTAALDAGIRQVVVLGAGYDSRAWRLARPGVRFFEVDHPATQADKRRRAPAGGPVYVPADLAVEALEEILPPAGFRAAEPAAFTVEGLTMYLSEDAVTSLLAALARLGAAGSRLAVNFGVGFASTSSRGARLTTSIARASFAAGHERFGFQPAPDAVPGLLAAAGWTVSALLTGPELGRRHPAGAGLPVHAFNPGACVVSAVRE